MAIPKCGGFHYVGVVPDTRADRESGQWHLKEQSDAPSDSTCDADLDRLRDNRLLGLRPTLRISGGHLFLEAPSRRRSEIRSASLELDTSLIASFQGRDVLTLDRTCTADIAVSLMRGGRLMVAVGAVTEVPLGDQVVVQGGPLVDYSSHGPEQWLPRDTWVDVSVSGETQRLRGGERTTICNYTFSVVRCFKDGMPGTCECIAITLAGFCPHEATLHSAELLARPHGGLIMTQWS